MQLSPLSYHRRIADALATREPHLWEWFASDRLTAEQVRETRIGLDKAALRIGRDDNPANARRYALADTACEKLALDAPVTLYQSLDTTGAPNAFLHYLPGEIAIQFSGRMLELLDESELLAVLGHEMAHYRLYQQDEGRHLVAVRALNWVCRREQCPAVWLETARRLSLWTEIYCDCAGLLVTGDRDVAIRSLAKLLADFRDADAGTYLAQAEAIVAEDQSRSRGASHPELYVRAKALALRATLDDASFETALTPLLDGAIDLAALDILEQAELEDATRAVADRFAQIDADRSDAVLAHIRLYFPRYRWPGRDRGPVTLPAMSAATHDYLAYVLLDLATVDPERREEGLTHAMTVAREAGIDEAFARIARSELKSATEDVARITRRSGRRTEAKSHG